MVICFKVIFIQDICVHLVKPCTNEKKNGDNIELAVQKHVLQQKKQFDFIF